MKTKEIVTVLLLAMVYALIIQVFSFTDMFNDRLIKVGWYNEYGESCATSVNPVLAWLFFPYKICYFVFTVLLLLKLKAHINKWLGGAAVVLYCICLIPAIYDFIFNMYVAVSFSGDDMYRPISYWIENGSYDYPFVWSYISDERWQYRLYMWRICNLISLIAYISVFAMWIKKDKIIGIVGSVAMLIALLFDFFNISYGMFVVKLCWIIMCATILWRLHELSKRVSKKNNLINKIIRL